MLETLRPAEIATPPASFADALTAVDRAATTAARLRAAADALHAWGFGRVLLTVRDSSLAPRAVAVAGRRERDSAPDAMQPLPGVVWRQRLPLLQPFARDGLFFLPGSDPWVAREFWADAPAQTPAPGEWGALDLIVGLVMGANGDVLGTALLAESDATLRPDRDRWFELFGLLRHLGLRLSHDAVQALAQRRADRLQRLQEAGATLARSLDEREIVRELARQVVRATDADGAMVAAPDLTAGTCRTLARVVGAAERPAEPERPLGDGVIATVAREGRSLRSPEGGRRGDLAASDAWSPLSALDVMGDVVKELGPPGSVIAVPIMVGIRLLGVLAVHATESDRFTAEDAEVVATMATQAATALANAQRYAESERERRQSEALAEVARAVGESLRPGDVMYLILRHALALLKAEGACIALRQDAWMHIVAASGAAELLAGVHVPIDDSLLGRVAQQGGQVLSNDLPAHSGAFKPLQRITRIRNTVIAPLTTAQGTIGAIAVLNRAEPCTQAVARILQRLGDQVSVAIANARLFEEVERATREWKVAFDSVASCLVVLDDARRIARCNRRLVELCGAPDVSAVLGASFPGVLWHDAAAHAATTLIERASAEGAVVRGEVLDDMRGRVFMLTAAPHPDGGSMVTVDDVTDER
jgi:GAF domain-containing protein